MGRKVALGSYGGVAELSSNNLSESEDPPALAFLSPKP